jgi:hypothetical protein
MRLETYTVHPTALQYFSVGSMTPMGIIRSIDAAAAEITIAVYSALELDKPHDP